MFATPLGFNPPTKAFPWDDLRKIFYTKVMDSQIKRRKNIAENFNRLSRAHERYRRQTTDGRTAIANVR